MDQQYRVVSTVHPASVGTPGDMHEFRLSRGGETAIMTIYQPTQLDLSKYGLTSGMGWILDCVFQEVNISSNELLFEWRSLDHILPESSYFPLNVSTEGLTPEAPWDYFHINSVDRNSDGDYLISGRHTHCIYKVSGQSGSILWELQGKQSTFEVSGFNFSWQHDARWLFENDTTSIISLFDNARRTSHEVDTLHSSGKVIKVNHVTNLATLVSEIQSPNTATGKISTESQGNLQLLPNSNIFLGWGAESHISEHLPNGTPIWHATFGLEHNPNYRAFKSPWQARPGSTIPAVWAYGRTNSSRTAVYMSWNGATEVRAWNVYGGESSSGPFEPVAMYASKLGFETTVVLEKYYPWVFAEAVGENRNGIRNSSCARTFTPSDALLPFCGEMYCLGAQTAETDTEEHVSNGMLTTIEGLSIIGLVALMALLVATRQFWAKLVFGRTSRYMKVESR